MSKAAQVELRDDKDGYAPVFHDVSSIAYSDFWVVIRHREDYGAPYTTRFPSSSVRCVREWEAEDDE